LGIKSPLPRHVSTECSSKKSKADEIPRLLISLSEQLFQTSEDSKHFIEITLSFTAPVASSERETPSALGGSGWQDFG
jgi:hypothetical protein